MLCCFVILLGFLNVFPVGPKDAVNGPNDLHQLLLSCFQGTHIFESSERELSICDVQHFFVFVFFVDFLCRTARAIWRGDGVFGPKLHLEGNMILWDLLQRHEPKIFCQSLWFVDVPVIHPSCRRMDMLAMHLPIFECFSWLLFHQVILCQCFASVSYGKWAVNFWCRSSLVSGCQLCSLPHHPWIVSTEVPWPT